MSRISYAAKRNFIPTDLDVTDTDISILASDDSFNSAGGDFAGLVAGDWVLVSGSAVDDGWHELALDSTAGKITTLSTLTDESIGSAITVIGYKHGLNEVYDIDFESQKLDKSPVAKTRVAESLSGVLETLLHSEKTTWDITTSYIDEVDLPEWLEFISSVRAGEVFVLDPCGYLASPDELLNCTLMNDPKISRISTVNTFTISFKARVQ